MNQPLPNRHPDLGPISPDQYSSSSPLVEIERKFLVKNNDWVKDVSDVILIKQGYLTNDGIKNIRVRSSIDKDVFKFTLTVKSCNEGMTRDEIEMDIRMREFDHLYRLASEGKIEKKRFIVYYQDEEVSSLQKKWEIDVFSDGLVIAEIELKSESEEFFRPDWLGEEVTDKKEYYNAELAKISSQ